MGGFFLGGRVTFRLVWVWGSVDGIYHGTRVVATTSQSGGHRTTRLVATGSRGLVRRISRRFALLFYRGRRSVVTSLGGYYRLFQAWQLVDGRYGVVRLFTSS